MADITSSSVTVDQAFGSLSAGLAREAIDAGELVYFEKRAFQGRYWCNLATHDNIRDIQQLGLCVAAASAANEDLAFYKLADVYVTLEATPFTLAIPYCLSATAGKIAPYTDLVSTDKVIHVGWVTSKPLLFPDDAAAAGNVFVVELLRGQDGPSNPRKPDFPVL